MNGGRNIRSYVKLRLRYVTGAALLLAMLTALLPSRAQAAEPILSDSALFERASTAYENEDWVDATRYLTAFIHRRPDALNENPEFSAEVETALQYSLDRIHEQLARKNATTLSWRQPRVAPHGESGVTATPEDLASAGVHGYTRDDDAFAGPEELPDLLPNTGELTLPPPAIREPEDSTPKIEEIPLLPLKPEGKNTLLLPSTIVPDGSQLPSVAPQAVPSLLEDENPTGSVKQ